MESDLIQELLSRHQNKPQPESVALTSVLTAIRDVVEDQALNVSPVSLFAAAVASLSATDAQANAQTSAALCTFLSVVLERLPAAFLRTQFASTVAMLSAVLERNKDEASVVKPALACLSTVLAAMDPTDWPTASQPYSVLLSFSLSARPKVRKRAHDGLVQVLASIRSTPAMAAASAALLQVCQKVLPGPEIAIQAGRNATKKSEAEALLHRTVNDALHLLTLLRLVLPLLAPGAATAVCALLLKLYHVNQRFLSRAATAAIASALAASDSRWSANDLASLLVGILDQQGFWDPKDAEVLLSVARIIDDALSRLNYLDSGLAATLLPGGVSALSSLLHAEQDGVRFAAAQTMKSVIRSCLDDAAIADAVNRRTIPGTKPAAATVVTACVVTSLAASRRSSWPHAMTVAKELLSVLGRQGRSLTAPLLHRLDEIAADCAEAMSDDDDDTGDSPKGVLATVAVAIQSLGPEHVLDTVPLHLEEGLNGSGEPRTWLLPLIRQHTSGASLAYWCSELLPTARACGGLAVGYAAGSSTSQSLAISCRALELQIWGTLPAFATWANDTDSSFGELAAKLGAAFHNRPDLRPTICRALTTLCLQNRLALKAAGYLELVAPGTPPCIAALRAGGAEDDGGDDMAHIDDGNDVPAFYTAAVATTNVKALRKLSMSWLPLLCSTFIAAPTEQRGPLGDAIAAYACISSPDVVSGFFTTAMQKFIQVVREGKGEDVPLITEGGDDPAARRGTFTDLALCLAGGLADAQLSTLFKAASSGMGEKDSGVQKKSYKALAYLCDDRPEWMLANIQAVIDTLAANRKGVASAARRFRLRCLRAVILLLSKNPSATLAAQSNDDGDDDDAMQNGATPHSQLVATLVGEIVLSCKEVNQKSRVAANEALVSIAHSMHNSNPPTLEAGGQGGLRDLFHMVIGGMVGESPHMIAAAVMAQARLLYEFGGALSGLVPDLMPAVLSLLRSKAREVIKAVLGMLKAALFQTAARQIDAHSRIPLHLSLHSRSTEQLHSWAVDSATVLPVGLRGQVVAMRLPVEALLPQLRPILEGVLLWASDSKNKFKLKVRLIVEKLARRCGFDAVQAAMPPGDTKLLSHIRKERTRKEVRKSGAAPKAEGQWEAAAAKTHVSAGARTARRSAWEQNDVFGSDNSADVGVVSGTRSKAGTHKSGRSAVSSRRGNPKESGAGKQGGRGSSGQAGGAPAGMEPVDLLDSGTARSLTRRAAGQHTADEEIDDFARDLGGRMVINKDDDKLLTKRKRGGDKEFGSEDSDDGFGKGAKGGKAVRFAKSTAGSVGGCSRMSGATARTFGGKSAASSSKRSVASAKESHHSGNRFKAKKAGGDVGAGNVEPYAYWPLDRKMLNRRPSKTTAAKAGLDAVVSRSSKGPIKHKSKQRRK